MCTNNGSDWVPLSSSTAWRCGDCGLTAYIEQPQEGMGAFGEGMGEAIRTAVAVADGRTVDQKVPTPTTHEVRRAMLSVFPPCPHWEEEP